MISNYRQSERDYAKLVRAHYVEVWKRMPSVIPFSKGPIHELPHDYQVLEFAPAERSFWTYATCGMSRPDDEVPIELHLFSPRRYSDHAELLTIITHYHRTQSRLGLSHTVNFGRPWMESSECEYGLVSLPYLDGPNLELLQLSGGKISFYWLLPITKAERDFATEYGLNALEERFETQGLNYLDPQRKSVVGNPH